MNIENDLLKLLLIIIFFIPGFISLKTWTMLVPSNIKKASDFFVEIIAYGGINFILWFWLLYLIFVNNNLFTFWGIILVIISLIVSPIILPAIWYWVLCTKLKKYILHPMPRSWDYFFSMKKPAYILVHLKNGHIIGGYYNGKSFVSSYPNEEDIYLEEVWEVDKKGKFIKTIDGTKGMWIGKEALNYLEFFEAKKKEG